MFASIASQESELLQFAAQFGIELDQGAGNAEASRAGLSTNPAAIGQDQNVETLCRFGSEQGLTHVGERRLADKLVFERPVVHRDLAFTGTQEHTRRRCFATTRSQLLN